MRLSAEDGAKAPFGWRDTVLDVDCSWNRAQDGQIRCLPAGPTWSGNTYGDEKCSRPQIEVPVPDASCVPRYVYEVVGVVEGSCNERRLAVRTTIGGADRLLFVYRITGAGCTRVDVDPDAVRFIELDAALPASDFVAATVEAE